MTILLEILLYLGMIQGSNTYQQSYINNLMIQNHQLINSVQSDGIMMNNINQQYSQDASQVVILEDKEEL